jgi:hypothetical protein
MRAAKGIFRTVNKPFGQVDARPSKSYRISWNGVCSRAAPRTTPLLNHSCFRPILSPKPTCLDVKTLIRFQLPGQLQPQKIPRKGPRNCRSLHGTSLRVHVPHLPVHFKLFGHEDSQLCQIAAPLGLGDIRSYPPLQGFQMAVFQRIQRGVDLSHLHFA